MVMHWRPLVAAIVVFALGATTSCKVLVEDNCANQSVPGNRFCRELYENAAPYCSPCRRELHGCVQAPPYGCEGYYDEISDDDPDDGPDDDGTSTGDAPAGSSTSAASSESGATADSGTEGSSGDPSGDGTTTAG